MHSKQRVSFLSTGFLGILHTNGLLLSVILHTLSVYFAPSMWKQVRSHMVPTPASSSQPSRPTAPVLRAWSGPIAAMLTESELEMQTGPTWRPTESESAF